MGLFGRKSVAVIVAYRELTRTADPTGHGYAFIWPFQDKPQPGLRVVVPGTDGQAYGVVLRTATTQDVRGLGPLKPIKRLATKDELEKARAKQVAETDRFWNQARIAAGLDKGRRAKVSDDFPQIHPASGSANTADADVYGRGWYGIWKRAEEEGRAPDEQAAYRALAYRWFAVRDKGGNG
jgi:hypothetical protein